MSARAPARRRAALAVAALLAVAAAAGFAREENPRLPGVCVAWPTRQVPVALHTAGYHGGCGSPAAAAEAIRAALLPWARATRGGEAAPCTDVAFTGAAETAVTALGYDGVNLIATRGQDCSAVSDALCQEPPDGDYGPCVERYDCWPDRERPEGYLALTTYTSRGPTLVDADVELHGWNGSAASPAGYDFTCADPPATVCAPGDLTAGDCIAYDLRNTVTHEAGHVLGLGHSDVPGATMAATAGLGQTDKRDLHADDVEGVCTIYPRGQATAACALPPAGGCASAQGAGPLALLALALLAAAGRARGVGPPP